MIRGCRSSLSFLIKKVKRTSNYDIPYYITNNSKIFKTYRWKPEINLDKTLKDMIHNNDSENEIADYVFKDNQSIDQASIDLIIDGVTSCEEIIRVNNIKEDASL